MSRRDEQRPQDILAAADAITAHLGRGGLDDGLLFDAVGVRLIEIGEAVRSIEPLLLAREPDVPWLDVAAMRNHLAHRYFDTAHAIVKSTVERELPSLVAAVRRLLDAPARHRRDSDRCARHRRRGLVDWAAIQMLCRVRIAA